MTAFSLCPGEADVTKLQRWKRLGVERGGGEGGGVMVPQGGLCPWAVCTLSGV